MNSMSLPVDLCDNPRALKAVDSGNLRCDSGNVNGLPPFESFSVRLCVWEGGQFEISFGQSARTAPKLPEFIDDFRNVSLFWGASPPDPPFDILLRIFNKKSSRRMPVCENFTRTQDRSIRALWIVSKMSGALCAHLKWFLKNVRVHSARNVKYGIGRFLGGGYLRIWGHIGYLSGGSVKWSSCPNGDFWKSRFFCLQKHSR